MFETRYQLAQAVLAGAFLLAIAAVVAFTRGALAVGVVCLVLEHGVAAAGCAVYAAAKGYPPLLGVPVGVGLGFMGAVVLMVLPDETPDDDLERQHRLAAEAYKNARDRDPGYEVLDDDE